MKHLFFTILLMAGQSFAFEILDLNKQQILAHNFQIQKTKEAFNFYYQTPENFQLSAELFYLKRGEILGARLIQNSSSTDSLSQMAKEISEMIIEVQRAPIHRVRQSWLQEYSSGSSAHHFQSVSSSQWSNWYQVIVQNNALVQSIKESHQKFVWGSEWRCYQAQSLRLQLGDQQHWENTWVNFAEVQCPY